MTPDVLYINLVHDLRHLPVTCLLLKTSKLILRFYEKKRKTVLEKVKEKRTAASEKGDGEPKKKKKTVYLVNNNKWYISATAREHEALTSVVLDGNGMENKHRIIQHSIR